MVDADDKKCADIVAAAGNDCDYKDGNHSHEDYVAADAATANDDLDVDDNVDDEDDGYRGGENVECIYTQLKSWRKDDC